MKEFDINNQNNVKILKIFTYIFIGLMCFGLITVWLSTTQSNINTSIIYTIIVIFICVTFISLVKNESENSKAVIIFGVCIYFYSLFFLYPEIYSTYILICFLPAIAILFFSKKIFYYVIIINIFFNISVMISVMLFVEFADKYTYFNGDIFGNLINFLSSQAILGFVFFITSSRIEKLKQYHFKIAKIADDKIEYMAYHDALTGLHNRGYFLMELNNFVEESKVNNTTLSLFSIDLDNFKKVNDTLGHDAGDILLIEIGNRISACLRKDYDVASRMGGDEFSVLLPKISNDCDVEDIASRILESFHQPINIDGIDIVAEFKITASIGIAMSSNGSVINGDTLIKNADIAMYKAKNSGKNKYCISND